MFKFVIKRNGDKVDFDINKIVNAIYKASSAVGNADWNMAKNMSEQVVKLLNKGNSKKIPSVEFIQDMVEKVLIDNNFAKIAKAYILYRRHRAQIRKEKEQILNTNKLDSVAKKFDLNALRVLASRYLKKDENGKVLESLSEMFERVAVNVVIPSLFYDKKVFKKNVKKQQNDKFSYSDIDIKKYLGKLKIGKYTLNKSHIESIKLVYNKFSRKGNVKVSLKKFLEMILKGEFDGYENEIYEYYDIMVSRKFLPNTPALVNFGNSLGMGSACFVLGIDDDIIDIMDKLKAAAIIFKSGGGVGYNFSNLRPEGDFVKSTGGVASGPISFMTMYDTMTDVIKQGGIRRGANMGILNSNHPDILKFIKSKKGNKALKNFNISVLLTEDFWKYYNSKKLYPLINPRNGKVVNYIDPRKLFDLIAYQAWESAEPGIIFFDKVNEYNPFLESLGPIVTTNPCGEVLLYPYESCNLGSINVWAFVEKKHGKRIKFNWDELGKTVKIAIRFLDNVIDVNSYPLKEIEEMSEKTRKIGLGVMGLADLLYELKIPYNTQSGRSFMEKLMEYINYSSKLMSIDLAKERGPMPMFKDSFYKDGKLPFSGFYFKKEWRLDWKLISNQIKKHGIRNGYTTVIAPTGSISMIAGTSSSIEPVYSLVFEKNVVVGNFYYVDPVFEEVMHKEGLMDDELIKDIVSNNGTIKNLSYIPNKLKKIFVTSHDISAKDHVKALASFQKWVDSSISKTINFPIDATVEDIKDAYLLAYKLGCKDVTVFRDGSIENQVLVSKNKKENKDKIEKKDENQVDVELIPVNDEKAKGLSVYKDASVSKSSDSGFYSVSGSGDSISDDDDDIIFNGPVTCKICNL